MIQDDNRKNMFIQSAAALSGTDPETLDELEAICILMEYESEARGDLYRRLVREAADSYFDDPENVSEWTEAAAVWTPKAPDLVALALRRELMPLVRELAADLREKLDESPEELDQITRTATAETLSETAAREVLHELVDDLSVIIDAGLYNPGAAVIETITRVLNSQEGVIKAVQNMSKTAANILQNLGALYDMADAIERIADKMPLSSLYRWATSEELAPYLAAELAKPQYEGKTFEELWKETETDDDGLFPNDSLIMQAVFAADAARFEAEPEAIREATDWKPAEVIRYKNRKAPNLSLSVGKGALRVFDKREWDRARALAARNEIPGQMSLFTIPVSYEKKGADEITLFCGMTSDSFLSALTPEDFFALSFIDDSFVNGNTKITLHKFFREYYGGKPSEKQLDDLYKKLEALASTTLKINDKQVREAWADKDEKRTKSAKYREIVQAAAPIKLGAEKYVVSGQVSDATMVIYDRPAVLQADRVAKQITTVPKTLLQVKKDNGRFVSRTPRFYRVLFYLIRRIALIKSGTNPNTLILDNFYLELGEETARGRALAYSVMMDIIHHFERENWITSHKTTTSKTTGGEALSFTWTDADGRVTRRAPRKRRRIPKKPAK